MICFHTFQEKVSSVLQVQEKLKNFVKGGFLYLKYLQRQNAHESMNQSFLT